MKRIKKIIEANVRQNHYIGSPCIIWCFDDRFTHLLHNFRRVLKNESGLTSVDVVKIAGGAKGLTERSEYMAKVITDNIKVSLRLHKCPWVGLMVHADCGAYGRNFSDAQKERDFYILELEKARRNLKTIFREEGISIPIKLFYADLGCLYLIS